MASRIEHQSPVTLGGVAALCAAIGLCALGIGQQTRPMPSAPMLVVVLLACAGGLIVVLTRVRLPQAIKMGCIFSMMCVMLLTVASGDMFGIKSTGKKLDKASSGSTTDPIATGGGRAMGAGGGDAGAAPGASVRLINASQGDLGWASRINGALDGRIGGDTSGWLRIDGHVLAQENGRKLFVMVDWSISGSDQSARCGSTSISGLDPNAILDQFRATFNAATIRSNIEGRATCP